MNRTQKFLYNSVSTAFQQIVVMIAGFIVPRTMLVYYGSEINGLITSISQFIGYFNLVEAGLANAAIYALYKPLAENDNKLISSIVSAARHFYNVAGMMFMSLSLGLAVIYPVFVKTESLSPFMVGLLVAVLGASGALEFITMSKYRVLLAADQKTYILSLATIAAIVINTVVIVGLSMLGANVVLMRAVALCSVFLRSGILWLYVKKHYKGVDYKAPKNNKALNKRWDALVLQILGTIQIGAPVVLATIFTDLKTVSVYTVFFMVINGINGVLSIFQSGLASSFGEVLAKGQTSILQKAYKEFEFSYYAILAFIYSVTAVMLLPFVSVYTSGITDVNYNVPTVAFLFVLNGILYNIKTPQSMLINSAGLYKETKVQTIIQGAIMVVLGAILAPIWGLEGILLASCASNLYRAVDLLFFIPKNVTKLPVYSSALRMLSVLVTCGLIFIPFMFIKIDVSGYLDWVIWAVGVSLFAAVCVFVMCVLTGKEELKNVLDRVKRLIFRR